MVRKILFQVHLWVGLVLGVFLSVIGISGSVLVYDHELMSIGAKPIPHTEAQGNMLPLDVLADAARGALSVKRAQITLNLPDEAGQPVVARIQTSSGIGPGARSDGDREHRGGDRQQSEHRERREGGDRAGQHRGAEQGGGAGRGPDGGRGQTTEVYLDPASGKVLDIRKTANNPVIGFFHQLHGNLFMGREGRQIVGWFGVAMVLLGLSGIYLWWPRRGAWKYAFGVRKKAKGYLFHRDLHGATGIWLWVVFIIVSFSGVVIAFPDTTRAVTASQSAASFDPRRGPSIEPVDDVEPISATAAVALVQKQYPGKAVTSITLPSRQTEAIRVSLGSMDEGLVLTAYVDPFRSQIVGLRNAPDAPTAERLAAWQRPLHAGEGWGAIWKALVFLSGFLPILFVITGTTMWLKKRKGRAATAS